MILSHFALAALFIPLFLCFMFVPALIELRKPKDAGPRSIKPRLIQPTPMSIPMSTTHLKFSKIADIEEPFTLDVTLKPFLDVIFSAWQTNEIEN
jgi:hypothetical protein